MSRCCDLIGVLVCELTGACGFLFISHMVHGAASRGANCRARGEGSGARDGSVHDAEEARMRGARPVWCGAGLNRLAGWVHGVE
jgi:hypothetical protein